MLLYNLTLHIKESGDEDDPVNTYMFDKTDVQIKIQQYHSVFFPPSNTSEHQIHMETFESPYWCGPFTTQTTGTVRDLNQGHYFLCSCLQVLICSLFGPWQIVTNGMSCTETWFCVLQSVWSRCCSRSEVSWRFKTFRRWLETTQNSVLTCLFPEKMTKGQRLSISAT